MPIYYFNQVTSAGKVVDFEGVELPNLEVARAEALLDARSLMAAALISGHDISARSFEICDETGEAVLNVKFNDAITLRE